MLLQYFDTGLSAGFPSPADDFLEQSLNLHELLVSHPAATFFVRAHGDSMEGAGIFSGDILVVDRSLSWQDGKIVVALLDGGFTVKRLKKKGKRLFLLPENPRYHPIEVTDRGDFQIWGIVTHTISRK